MNRKEIIVAAALVNAGLLIILFASALKSDGDAQVALVKDQSVEVPASKGSVSRQEASAFGDEVDRALQKLASSQASSSEVKREETSRVSAVSTPSHSAEFVDDIKSIAKKQEERKPQESSKPTVHTLVAPMTKTQGQTSPFVEVKVKKGDVLEKIARHHHCTVAEIMQTNNLASTNLRIGQTLKVPEKSAPPLSSAPSSHTVTAASSSEGKWYVVKKGDSPWTIAVKNQMKVNQLLKLNQMTEEQARRLKPGDKIRIE